MVDLVVLLEVADNYWSYPGWQSIEQGIGREAVALEEGLGVFRLIETFAMPPVSPAGPLYFYAGLFEPGTLSLDTLVSNGAVWEFWLAD
jgi:hypothetical protein